MKKRLNILWNNENRYMRLASVNRKAILTYNKKILSAMTLIGGLLMMLPLLTAPLSNTKPDLVPTYLLSAALFFILLFVSRLPLVKEYTLYVLYLCFSVFFLFAIYLSVIHSPDMRATILLGAFCIVPFSFIDRPARINLFVAFWFGVHTVSAFHLKPQYALDDTINCLCFAILGCYIGNMTMWIRLEGYEAQRLLTIEKETDVLTGLYNRRKLFETLANFEAANAETPSGILMIDIDHFKEYNDRYGHAAGDKCLSRLGDMF